MSEEVVIVAIVEPAKGKADRLKEVFAEAFAWIEENESETLQFAMFEEQTDDGVKLSMFERYASQAALDKHESSDNYKKFHKVLMEEQLLAGPPLVTKGKHSMGFKR